MCVVAGSERRVTISFTLSEARALLEDDVGTDAFELKAHRFRQKLGRALKEIDVARAGFFNSIQPPRELS